MREGRDRRGLMREGDDRRGVTTGRGGARAK